MRVGVVVVGPLWRRLSCSSPSCCASSCYGSVWRHQGTALLPNCCTALERSKQLHTTPPAHKTRRFFFENQSLEHLQKPLQPLQESGETRGSLRRPRKGDDGASHKTLKLIKQATAFLKKEEVLSLQDTPAVQAPSHSDIRTQRSYSDSKSSASAESENIQTSSIINKKTRYFDSTAFQDNNSSFENNDQSLSSDGLHSGENLSRNDISFEEQFLGEHSDMEGEPTNGAHRRFYRNKLRAAENSSTNQHKQEGKEGGDLEGEEWSSDRDRFRRRYTRKRLDNNFPLTSYLPANTMDKIKEANHLMRHGTVSSIPLSSSSGESNMTERKKYFDPASLPQEITPPAVDPDMTPEQAPPKPRGRKARRISLEPDSILDYPVTDLSYQHAVNRNPSSLAPSTEDSSLTTNKEPLKKSPAPLSSTPTFPYVGVAKSVPLCTPYARHVPRTGAEQLQQMQAPVNSPPNSKLLRVALLGLPNSGKSTLVNTLLEDRVCSVSNKPNTTRCLARAIYTTDDTQLVFLDTPGVVTPEQTIKHRLFGSVVQDAERSLAQADLLLLLHDCSCPFNRLGLHPRLLRVLALHPHLPSILVLNKVDLANPKQQLLKLTRVLTEGYVKGRQSHNISPSKPRHPFDNVTRNPEAIINSFLKSLEQSTPSIESSENELPPDDEDQLPESIPKLEPSHQMQQVSFEQLMSNERPVVLPCLGTANKFHVNIDVNDEDVLSGRVKLSEQQLTAFIEGRKGWPYFERVLLTSALTGDGVQDLRQVLEDSAVPAPWQYPAAMITDQDPYQMATLTVREKFMDKFKYQLPYNLRFEVDNWEIGDAGKGATVKFNKKLDRYYKQKDVVEINVNL